MRAARAARVVFSLAPRGCITRGLARRAFLRAASGVAAAGGGGGAGVDGGAPAAAALSAAAFHAAADAQLARLEAGVEAALDAPAAPRDADVSLAQGVLTLRLGGARGTIVINKQAPTRQLWWSSPASGPRRFELDAARGAWLDARSRTELCAELARELRAAASVDASF